MAEAGGYHQCVVVRRESGSGEWRVQERSATHGLAHGGGGGLQVRRPVFQRIFWDLGPGHKPDISLEKYKAVIKLLVAATAGCQGAKN
jgi:hypothetical protein